MKLKISPNGTPSLRRRTANGEHPRSPRIKLARWPEAFAGESKKILRHLDREEDDPVGCAPAARVRPANLMTLPCISLVHVTIISQRIPIVTQIEKGKTTAATSGTGLTAIRSKASQAQSDFPVSPDSSYTPFLASSVGI